MHRSLGSMVAPAPLALMLLLVCAFGAVNAIRVPLAVTGAQYEKCLETPPGTKISSWCADGTITFCCKAKVSNDKYAGCCREVLTCGDATTGGWYRLCCYGIVNAGPFTTDKPDLYCTSLGLKEPSGTVWTNNAGPFGQKTSAFGQAPWAGSVGQPASQGTVKSPAGSVGKVTIDEETPAASATVPAARTDTPAAAGGANSNNQVQQLEEELNKIKTALDAGAKDDLPDSLKKLRRLVNDVKRKMKSLPREAKQKLAQLGKGLRRLAPLTDGPVAACMLRCDGCAMFSEKSYTCPEDCDKDPTMYMDCD